MNKIIIGLLLIMSLSSCANNKYIESGADLLGVSSTYKSVNKLATYGLDGYDSRGFNERGIHKDTKTLFDPEGFNVNGWNGNGWNKDKIYYKTGTKYNKKGYDILGFNKDGYNSNGFNRNGTNIETGTKYDKRGFNIKGINASGFTKYGVYAKTKKPYDPEGFDSDGYNLRGFNREGINKFTNTSYDQKGYNASGFNKSGLNSKGEFKTGKYDKNGFDSLGWNKSKTKHKYGTKSTDRITLTLTSPDYTTPNLQAYFSYNMNKNSVGYGFKDLKVNGKPVKHSGGEYTYQIITGNTNTLSYTVVLYEKDNNGRTYIAREYKQTMTVSYKNALDWSEKTKDKELKKIASMTLEI